mgnify:FL=1
MRGVDLDVGEAAEVKQYLIAQLEYVDETVDLVALSAELIESLEIGVDFAELNDDIYDHVDEFEVSHDHCYKVQRFAMYRLQIA